LGSRFGRWRGRGRLRRSRIGRGLGFVRVKLYKRDREDTLFTRGQYGALVPARGFLKDLHSLSLLKLNLVLAIGAEGMKRCDE